jgi:hypothetical protein
LASQWLAADCNHPGGEAHVSEAGSPHARYAVLDIGVDQVSADMIAIAYD